jgi:hypothetical protein
LSAPSRRSLWLPFLDSELDVARSSDIANGRGTPTPALPWLSVAIGVPNRHEFEPIVVPGAIFSTGMPAVQSLFEIRYRDRPRPDPECHHTGLQLHVRVAADRAIQIQLQDPRCLIEVRYP